MPVPLKIKQAQDVFYSKANNNNFGEISSAGLKNIEPIYRTQAANGPQEFRYIGTNTSVRDSFNRFDYEYFKQDEAIPKRIKDILSLCMAIYQRNGLIYNIINLMSDFASQGIRIVHEDEKTQALYTQWFNEKVNGPERTERIFNMLFRTGNVIIQRSTGIIPDSMARQMQTVGADLDTTDNSIVIPREVPWKYYIHNPLTVNYLKPNCFLFSENKFLTVKISEELKRIILSPKDEIEKRISSEIPKSIKDSINAQQPYILLPPEKIELLFYKKDDWMPWAIPMIYPIIDDLFIYEKLRLADLSALDGAISKVRVWKIGDIDAKIFPTDAAIQKLGGLLMNTAGNGSVLDLIWGPAISLEETKTDTAMFLGSEKYQQTLAAIYAGLGVPQMLTGSPDGGGNMTDNFIQIKVLVERLEYGRRVVTPFWKGECERFRKAMKGIRGFNSKIPAEIAYDHTSLTDEAAQMKLLLDLVDRDIISIESARESVKVSNAIEKSRINREISDRDKNPKISPYHDANPELSLKKLFAQKGIVTPSEVGVELKPRKAGEKPMMEFQQTQKLKSTIKGKPGQGRPKNAIDTKPRKQRIPLVAEEANLLLWSLNSYNSIANLLLPFFTNRFNKDNARKFTDVETDEFEQFKFGVLCNIEPFTIINDQQIVTAISKPFLKYEKANQYYEEYLKNIANSDQFSLNEKRQLQCLAYVRSFECQ